MPSPRVKAFLDLIAWSEGTSTSPITQDDGYDIIVSGVDGPNRFDDYTQHPFAQGHAPVLVRRDPPLESTASGRYQQLLRNWLVYKEQLNLPDFGHESQDKIAIQLMNECHAVVMVEAGNVEAAIAACSSRWASFPGNVYGQPTNDMEILLQKYQELLA